MPKLAGVRIQERADLADNIATCIHTLTMSLSSLLQDLPEQQNMPDSTCTELANHLADQ